MLLAERSNPDSNIKNASDAVWWAFVSITTVGYGDRYPTTNWSRIVGLFVMMIGMGLFGVLTGYLANALLAPPKQSEDEKQETAQLKTQMQAQFDPQVMLTEMKRLLSEQEKALEGLRATLATVRPLPISSAGSHELPIKEPGGQ